MVAKWMGVEPWTLAEKPLIWREWARAAIEAENLARPERERNAAAFARAGRRAGR